MEWQALPGLCNRYLSPDAHLTSICKMPASVNVPCLLETLREMGGTLSAGHSGCCFCRAAPGYPSSR